MIRKYTIDGVVILMVERQQIPLRDMYEAHVIIKDGFFEKNHTEYNEAQIIDMILFYLEDNQCEVVDGSLYKSGDPLRHKFI